MATTKYEIFCKYYHSTVNRIVNNVTPVEWVQAEKSCGGVTPRNVNNAKSEPGVENCWVRPEDGLYSDTNGAKRRAAVQLDNNLYSLMTAEVNHENPKYDMIFVYDGVTSTTCEEKRNKSSSGDKSTPPIVYYERMRRLEMVPWFLYTTCASLTAAMTKAGELVNLVGKDNVIIGKVVSLDQYIEIV